VSLTKQIAIRVGDEQYNDDLPDNLLDQFKDNDEIDPDELDLAVHTSKLYPNWTSLRALVTTLTVVAVLWPALLVVRGSLSLAQVLAGDLPVADLLTFTVYGYFSVALAIGTGVSASLWYVSKAPPEVFEHLDTSPLSAFIETTVISSLMLLLAVLGGWLLLFIGLLTMIVVPIGVLVVLLGSILYGLAGLLTLDGKAIAESIAAFVATFVFIYAVNLLVDIWPSGIPIEYYALPMTYMLALFIAVTFPTIAVYDDLESYRKRLGEMRTARNLLETDIQKLREESPRRYDVEITLPDNDVSLSTNKANETAIEAFDLVDTYEQHIEVMTDLQSQQRQSDIIDLLSTAVVVTYPPRCASPEVAMNAVDALVDLVDVYEKNKNEWSNNRLSETRLEEVFDDLETNSITDSNDVQQLQDACKALEHWITQIKKRDEFDKRTSELRIGLASVFDKPPEVEFDSKSINNQNWMRLEQYERILSQASRAADLRREHPNALLPKVILERLYEEVESVNIRNLDSYELLIDVAKLALDTTNEYSTFFDHAQSQVLDIARTDPDERSDDLEALQEVFDRGTRIVEFLNRVDPDHPSVSASDWRKALTTAVKRTSPNVLRPIDNQIQTMQGGMWEHSDLFEYNWQEFESLVGSLYADKGYNIEVTTDTNDGGVDVWARSETDTVAIQVKQNSTGNTVGRRVLQQLASTIAMGSADRVVIVTSAEFATTAVEYATAFGPEMELINGEELVRRLSMSDLPPPRPVET